MNSNNAVTLFCLVLLLLCDLLDGHISDGVSPFIPNYRYSLQLLARARKLECQKDVNGCGKMYKAYLQRKFVLL
jgi:hypothetical protein